MAHDRRRRGPPNRLLPPAPADEHDRLQRTELGALDGAKQVPEIVDPSEPALICRWWHESHPDHAAPAWNHSAKACTPARQSRFGSQPQLRATDISAW